MFGHNDLNVRVYVSDITYHLHMSLGSVMRIQVIIYSLCTFICVTAVLPS